MRDRLKARMRRALAATAPKLSPSRVALPRETSPRDGSALATTLALPTPEPVREGRLLVWRESFCDAAWSDDGAAAVFGDDAGSASALRERLVTHGIDPDDSVWVDIETCGLGNEPIFLVGVLTTSAASGTSGARIELQQFFAPDPSAEPEMLRASIAALEAHRRRWVSFNGRSFDVPRLRRRAHLHSIAFPECDDHVDLLLAVRRRWKKDLPNCRLSTVEERLLGLRRLPGDVPGREVPERYWDFVHGGERRWVDPVIEHNRRDIAALLVLDGTVLDGTGFRGAVSDGE